MMEASYALFGFGHSAVQALLHMGAILRPNDAAFSLDGRHGLLITQAHLVWPEPNLAVRPICSLDHLVRSPSLVVIIIDCSDRIAAEDVRCIIEQAVSADIPCLIINSESPNPAPARKHTPVELLGWRAHAVITMMSTPLYITLSEKIAHSTLSIMQFAMKGSLREALDFCDLSDVLWAIQGYACLHIDRILAAHIHDISFSNPFLHLVTTLPSAPERIYLSVGGCEQGLLDHFEMAYASLADAIGPAWPAESPRSAIVPTFFANEALGDQLEIVTCFTLPYEQLAFQRHT